MKVVLPDNSTKELGQNATALDLASSIGPGLAKQALAARVNGNVTDLTTTLHDNDEVAILTFDSEEGRDVFWHSSAHILAHAVKELFPQAKVAIGPPVENGFYYDFDVEQPFTPQDLERIEQKCREIISQKIPIEKRELSGQEIEQYFSRQAEVYKLELLHELNETPTVYRQGEWMDLCRGPHVPHTGYVKAFKVLHSAGAYWRGDQSNRMLQRIYGTSFPKKQMLDDYLYRLEEAKKRDHRKLGTQLALFSFHEEAAGFPFWHPAGTILYNTIVDYSRSAHRAAGYREIRTPYILNQELWKKSGHWDKYRDNMYCTDIDDVAHAVKPMNCPAHLLVYNNTKHSYREFPLRYFEFGSVHRHEKSGVLHGLFRVRQFTQDDAHIFCTPQQLEAQIDEVITFILHVYEQFGFSDYAIELSTRPEKYIGSLQMWEQAENALSHVLESRSFDYQLNEGDGAFYGPKIDFHIMDSLQRSWQCGTIQVDFSMPQRFELRYTDADGNEKQPVMIHRALMGSMERFIGILIEHFGGDLPLWLAPVQVKVIPISDRFLDYAHEVCRECTRHGIRAEVDSRSEKVGYKIREAEIHKIPCMAVVGEKEQQCRSVSPRYHTHGDANNVTLDEFIASLRANIDSKSLSYAA